MSNIGNKVVNKLAKGWVEKIIPQPTDPVFEFHEDSNGRRRKRKRPLPRGLSDRDEEILKSVRKRARRLDQGMNFCGMRFGWTFIIGLIPGAGDAADAVLGYVLVIRKAKQADIPSSLVFHMLRNIALATAIGSIPLAGDVFIAGYKANSRNAMLFERFLMQRGAEAEAVAAEARQVEEANRAAARAAAEEVAGDQTRMASDKSDAVGEDSKAAQKPERWPLSLFMKKRKSKTKGDEQHLKGRFIEHVDNDPNE